MELHVTSDIHVPVILCETLGMYNTRTAIKRVKSNSTSYEKQKVMFVRFNKTSEHVETVLSFQSLGLIFTLRIRTRNIKKTMEKYLEEIRTR